MEKYKLYMKGEGTGGRFVQYSRNEGRSSTVEKEYDAAKAFDKKYARGAINKYEVRKVQKKAEPMFYSPFNPPKRKNMFGW
jgi:hypothetical protein